MLAEKFFDQVPPFVNLQINFHWRYTVRYLVDDDIGTALIQFSDQPVRIKFLVSDQPFEFNTLDQRGNP